MKAFAKLAGRPFGLTPLAWSTIGSKNPEMKKLTNWIKKSPEILNQRRAIVRRMQIANLLKGKKS